jgi:uncharacterized protein YndB with AHSA1/START domain
MQKLHIVTYIGAPREKVWKIMLEDATYRDWTSAFSPGSYYEGNWNKGSTIRFIGPDPKTGKEGGMVSRIEESRPYEFVSIQHLAVIQDGVEQKDSSIAKDWVGAHENYTFTDKDGGTELAVDMDVAESEKENMLGMWKMGLKRLKELAEK